MSSIKRCLDKNSKTLLCDVLTTEWRHYSMASISGHLKRVHLVFCSCTFVF
jgi:hypothetical protein